MAKSCLTLKTSCTVALLATLSMGFPRQEYRSGFPFPSPGDLPNPGIEWKDTYWTGTGCKTRGLRGQ